jgi:hypothetical protein
LDALSDPCETPIALFSNFGKIFDPNLPLSEVNIVALYLLKTKNNNCVWKEPIHGPDDRRRLYSRVALRLEFTCRRSLHAAAQNEIAFMKRAQKQ